MELLGAWQNCYENTPSPGIIRNSKVLLHFSKIQVHLKTTRKDSNLLKSTAVCVALFWRRQQLRPGRIQIYHFFIVVNPPSCTSSFTKIIFLILNIIIVLICEFSNWPLYKKSKKKKKKLSVPVLFFFTKIPNYRSLLALLRWKICFSDWTLGFFVWAKIWVNNILIFLFVYLFITKAQEQTCLSEQIFFSSLITFL